MTSDQGKPAGRIRVPGQRPGSRLGRARGAFELLFRPLVRRNGEAALDLWQHLRRPEPWLAVLRIGPDPVVENRPAWIEFVLYNGADRPCNGVVILEVWPSRSLDPVVGRWEWPIEDLQPVHGVRGVIAFDAPRADTGNAFVLRFLDPGNAEVATATGTFDIAGRYSLIVDQLRIEQTASDREDAVAMSVSGVFEGRSWTEARALGPHREGTIPVSFVEIGPFDSINGVSPDTVLTWLVASASGGDDETTAQILDALSELSAAVATTVCTLVRPAAAELWVALGAAVDALVRFLDDLAIGDGDTVTAFDTKTFGSQLLYDATDDLRDDRTESTPEWTTYVKPAGDKEIDALGGGCRDSRYAVRTRIVRHRAPDEILSLRAEGSEQPLRLAYDARHVVRYPSPPGVVWEWELEGSGRIDATGEIQAPPAPLSSALLRSDFAVIRGRGLVDGRERFRGVTFVRFDRS